MAITYLNGSSVVNNADGVILGVQGNVEVGSFNGHFQYAEPSTSGLTPEGTILGLGQYGSPLLGEFVDADPIRGIRNYRVVGLPSGYSTLGVPTFGSGRVNINTSVGRDYGLTASGTYRFISGRNVQSKRYDQLSS